MTTLSNTSNIDDLNEDDFVCHECVQDKFLGATVRRLGRVRRCAVCEKRRKAITVVELGETIKEALRVAIRRGQSFPHYTDSGSFSHEEQLGDELSDLIQMLTGVDDERLVNAIMGQVAGMSYIDMTDGGEAEFDDDAKYVLTKFSTLRMEDLWLRFQQGIRHQSRFFNEDAQTFLRNLFADINGLRSSTIPDWPPIEEKASLYVVPAVRAIKPGDGWTLVRARRVSDFKEFQKFQADAANQMSAPPASAATAGRMNPDGVPAFYCASDAVTAIAELRPWIGAMTATAEFRITQRITVLDFRVLETAYHQHRLSIFDPEYRERSAARRFVQRLHVMIREPVHPGKEALYLTTQVMSEYLAVLHMPRIDGLLFGSAQRATGTNLVLFPMRPDPAATPDLSGAGDDVLLQDLADIPDPNIVPRAEFPCAAVKGTVRLHQVTGIDYKTAFRGPDEDYDFEPSDDVE